MYKTGMDDNGILTARIKLTPKQCRWIARITNDNKYMSMESYIRKSLYNYHEDLYKKGISLFLFREIKNLINSLTYMIQFGDIRLADDRYYYFGWRQIFNRLYYLDYEQKRKPLLKPYHLINDDTENISKLIEALKSVDLEYTMTAFAFILFSITKSLYKSPKLSNDKDIQLFISDNTKAKTEQGKYSLIYNIIHLLIDDVVNYDYISGNIINSFSDHYIIDQIGRLGFRNKDDIEKMLEELMQGTKTHSTANQDNRSESNKKNIPKLHLTYIDYPIISSNTNMTNRLPSSKHRFRDASYIFFNHIGEERNRYIPVTVPSDMSSRFSIPGKIFYIEYLEELLSDLANEKSEGLKKRLENNIKTIIKAKQKSSLQLSKKNLTEISKCIFKICFPRNQHVTYFDDLYKESVKELSASGGKSELVNMYAYMLASVKGFQNYVHECCNSETADEYDKLYDEAKQIFMKRCDPDDSNWHLLNYEEKLIVCFGRFISEVPEKYSEIIVTPSKKHKKHNDMIYLEFYDYFELFSDFCKREGFLCNISNEKFNRLLNSEEIVKERDNVSKRLDYILQQNGTKRTVLAVRTNELEKKCKELTDRVHDTGTQKT